MKRLESDGYATLQNLVKAIAPALSAFVPMPIGAALQSLPRLLAFAHGLTAEGHDLDRAITRIEDGEPLFDAADAEMMARIRARWRR